MKKSIFLFFAAILCAMNASAWSYKSAANNWTASTSGFKSVTMNSGKNFDVVMLKDVGDGVNICQNDNGSGHTLYCKWTKASGDIFRGTARWNNGLYCDETVVVPGGKVYIKVGSGTQVQMTAGTDYTYTADVTFSTTGQSYTISGGTVSGATIKNENSMPSGGKPASLTMKNSYTSKNAGSVHIVFDLRTNKVTETAEEPEAPEPIETTTLYYVNSGEWSSVNAYVWVAESNESYKPWSGEAATKTDKTVYDEASDKTYDVYSYTFPITYNRVIFNGDGKQTQDAEAVYDAAKPYLCNAVWYESLEAVKEALKKPIPDETVYFINTGKWSKVMIYTWNGSGATSWPGVEMTKTSEVIGEYEVYSYTAKQGGQANLLFQESADVNKTADQTWQAGKYYMCSTNEWYDTKEAAEAALAGPATIVLHGNFVNPNWADTEKLTISDDQKTATITVLIEKGTYEFGVKQNGKWVANGKAFTKDNNEHEIVDGSGNLTLAADITGNYTFTWTYETNILSVTYPTEEVVVEKHYYVKGTHNEWTADATSEMILDGDVYKKEVTLAKDVEFKINDGASAWWGANNLGGKVYKELEGTDNIKMKEAKTFTIIFNPSENLITFEGLTPAETKYYIAGTQNLTGFDWQVDGLEIAKAGDVYKHTFSEMSAGTYEFKITDGTWEHQWNYSNLAKNYVGVEQGKDDKGDYNGNIKIVTEEAKTITVIFDPANNTITLENWAEAAPTTISYVLMGVNGDWTNGIPMTVNPDNADEYVLTDQVIIKATDAVKVVTLTDGQATAWCGNVDAYSNATYTADATNGNIVLEDGIYTFYFKKNTDNIYINQTGYARNVTNKYGTICLPYASASTSGATFYEVVGQEDGKVYLGSVNTLAAGVPYIFEKSANQIKVVYTGDKKDAAGSANGLVGTFADNTPVPNDAYILHGGKFCTNNDPTEPNKINAYRAYLNLSAVIGGKPQQMPGRRYIGMDVQGENEATGFENIVAPEGQTIKAIVNGQLVIIRGGEMYNVQGQKL